MFFFDANQNDPSNPRDEDAWVDEWHQAGMEEADGIDDIIERLRAKRLSTFCASPGGQVRHLLCMVGRHKITRETIIRD